MKQYVETLVRRLTFFYSFCVRNFFFRNDSWHSPTEYHPQQSFLTSPSFSPHVWVYLCICMYVNLVFFSGRTISGFREGHFVYGEYSLNSPYHIDQN